VIAAVTTSVVTLLPLFYIGGIMGKLISIMPAVVIACLAVSLVECLMLLPAHLSHLPNPESKNNNLNPLTRKLEIVHRLTSSGMEWFVAHVYTPLLSKALYWRYISLCIAVSILLLTIGLIKGGILKFEIFPEVDGFIITSTVEFPSGTPSDVTKQAIEQIDAALLRLAEQTETRSGDPLIEDRMAMIGQTMEGIPRSGPHLGSVQAILLDSKRRGIHTKDLMIQWEKER
jgi:multidrug efflux pump subunit AcrB